MQKTVLTIAAFVLTASVGHAQTYKLGVAGGEENGQSTSASMVPASAPAPNRDAVQAQSDAGATSQNANTTSSGASEVVARPAAPPPESARTIGNRSASDQSDSVRN